MTATSPVRAEAKLWEDAAGELAPAKSLGRTNDDAKFLAGSLSIVGSVFAAVGLLSIDRLRTHSILYVVGLAAALFALAAVLLSVAMLVPRLGTVRTGNLLEVQKWYAGQLKRARILGIAGEFLVIAIFLGGFASGWVLVTDRTAAPFLSIQLAGSGPDAKLSGKVTIAGLARGAMVETQLIGVRPDSQEIILVRSRSLADDNGKVDISADVGQVSNYQKFRLEVLPAGRSPLCLDLPAAEQRCP